MPMTGCPCKEPAIPAEENDDTQRMHDPPDEEDDDFDFDAWLADGSEGPAPLEAAMAHRRREREIDVMMFISYGTISDEAGASSGNGEAGTEGGVQDQKE